MDAATAHGGGEEDKGDRVGKRKMQINERWGGGGRGEHSQRPNKTKPKTETENGIQGTTEERKQKEQGKEQETH